MTYQWRDPPVDTRRAGRQFPQLIILPGIFDGSEEAGEGLGATRDGCFPRVQHPEPPDQSGISPDQPGEAPAQRGSSWEPPISFIRLLGRVKPPLQPGEGGILVLHYVGATFTLV